MRALSAAFGAKSAPLECASSSRARASLMHAGNAGASAGSCAAASMERTCCTCVLRQNERSSAGAARRDAARGCWQATQSAACAVCEEGGAACAMQRLSTCLHGCQMTRERAAAQTRAALPLLLAAAARSLRLVLAAGA
jgi:hypothetical protein